MDSIRGWHHHRRPVCWMSVCVCVCAYVRQASVCGLCAWICARRDYVYIPRYLLTLTPPSPSPGSLDLLRVCGCCCHHNRAPTNMCFDAGLGHFRPTHPAIIMSCPQAPLLAAQAVPLFSSLDVNFSTVAHPACTTSLLYST
jgi:hypothetical protein